MRRCRFFQGRAIRGTDVKDIMWLRADGQEMTDEDWNSSWIRCIGIFISGEGTCELDAEGKPVVDDTFIMLLNSYHEPISFLVPDKVGSRWEVVLDTNMPDLAPGQRTVNSGEPLDIAGRSVVLLRLLRKQRTAAQGLLSQSCRLCVIISCHIADFPRRP